MRRRNASSIKVNMIIVIMGVARTVVDVQKLDSGNIEFLLDDNTKIRRAPLAKINLA